MISCMKDTSPSLCYSESRAAMHINGRHKQFLSPSSKGNAATEDSSPGHTVQAQPLKQHPAKGPVTSWAKPCTQLLLGHRGEASVALQEPASLSDRRPHCAVIIMLLRAYRCFHTVPTVQGSVKNRGIITMFILSLIQIVSIH